MSDADKFQTAKERHERGFTGVWIPWFLFDLLEQGKINGTDLLMFLTISSFCKKGRCFASNDYLGKRIGISGKKASEIVSKLKRMGLIEQVGFDGRRRILRVLYDKEGNVLTSVRGNLPPGNRGTCLPEIGEADSGKSTPYEYKEEEGSKEFKIGESDDSPPDERVQHLPGQKDMQSSGTESNGSSRKERRSKQKDRGLFSSAGMKKEKPNPRLSAFDTKAAKRIKQILVENQETSLLNVKESTLAQRIHRLRKVGIEEDRIKKVIGFLRKNYQEEDIAHFRRADDIFDHFKRLEDAMKRREKSMNCNGGPRFSTNGRVEGVARLSNGATINSDNMWYSENWDDKHVPKVWADYDGKQYDGRTAYNVRRRFREKHGDDALVTQDRLDEVLQELGMPLGSIPKTVVMS